MRKKSIKVMNTKCDFIVANYVNNNNLYLGLVDHKSGEPYADATVNLYTLDKNQAFMKLGDPITVAMVRDDLITATSIVETSGFAQYILVNVNMDKLNREFICVE